MKKGFKVGIGIFIAVCLISSIVFSTIINISASPSGSFTPVHSYSFNSDSGSTVIDSITSGGINGTATAGFTTITEGSDTFRRFNGTSNYISFGNQVLPKGKKSIEFRFRRNGLPPNNITVLDNAIDPSKNGTGINIIADSGAVDFTSSDASGTFRFNVYANQKNVCDGQWHHILCTWDGSTDPNGVKVYIDDMTTPVATGTAKSYETADASYNLLIGRRTLAAIEYLSGDLDYINIYNTEVIGTPKNLNAVSGPNKITLTWDPVSGAQSYKVYRAASSNSYSSTPYVSNISPTLINGKVTFEDSAVSSGTTYYYVVAAMNKYGDETANSDEISAAPNSPETNFIVTATVPGTLASWPDNYGVFFTAPFPCEIVSVREVHASAAVDSGNVVLDIEKLTGSQAPNSGVSLLDTAIDLKNAANTVQAPSLNSNTANIQLGAGDRLCLKDVGVLSGLNGVSITIELKRK
ncbi:MAG: LamG domain-containing protein [Clostridia bacterium]|nr:LamG domain-containing protein [Clostridia bacterium]